MGLILYRNKDWLYEQYVNGKLSTREIARKYNFGKSTIQKWLKRLEIPARTRSEALKISSAGEKHSKWNGGKKKDGNGYVMIWKPDHPHRNSGKYVYEHRLIMEKYLGRYLLPTEEIHHKNRLVDDNRIENLRLFESKSAHRRFENNTKSRLAIGDLGRLLN